MEFDKSKILTVVTADQAKVGSMGYFSNYITALKGYVEDGYNKQAKLTRVILDTVYPFFNGHNYYSLFYPAPEPEQTYAERQAEWIKANNVKVGTKVRFTKGFNTAEDGSGCCEHRDAKGVEGFVSDIEVEYLFVRIPSAGWAVPFTALEVIKEPTYRPYNNDELNDLVGEILTNKQSGRKKLVTGKPTASEGVNLDGSYISAKDLLASFMMDDGKSPCGIKEEV